jgi:hypothetical protein
MTPAERGEFLVSFAAFENGGGLPPRPASGAWTTVYAVNDFGDKPSSHSAPLFCKSHLLVRCVRHRFCWCTPLALDPFV